MKNAIVALVVQAAQQLGLRLVAEDGRDAWTGHVFRITGSRRLARNGVDQALIMLLARWASAVILAYLKEAPLEILTDKYRSNVGTALVQAASSASSSSAAAEARTKDNEKALKNLTATVKKFDSKVMTDLAMLREECTKLRADQESLFQRLCDEAPPEQVSEKYVISKDGEGSYHLPAPYVGVPNKDWICKCGFRYGFSPIARSDTMPEDLCYLRICKRCLPREWAAHYKLLFMTEPRVRDASSESAS